MEPITPAQPLAVRLEPTGQTLHAAPDQTLWRALQHAGMPDPCRAATGPVEPASPVWPRDVCVSPWSGRARCRKRRPQAACCAVWLAQKPTWCPLAQAA